MSRQSLGKESVIWRSYLNNQVIRLLSGKVKVESAGFANTLTTANPECRILKDTFVTVTALERSEIEYNEE